MLRNYEMEEEIYCFIIFTIAKYGRIYIIIEREFAYHGIPFVLNENRCFVRDERYCLALINTFRPERE
jgi:hypothetical protein